jgi:mono/diheme cytochrome c family protein
MGKWLLLDAFVAVIIITASHGMAADKSNGSELFKKHCSMCHPIAAVMRDSRIVEIIRNPKQDMPKFDVKNISDKDASAIADYIKLQIAMKSICEVK